MRMLIRAAALAALLACLAALPAATQSKEPPTYEELLPPEPRVAVLLDEEAEKRLKALEDQVEAMPEDPDLQSRLGMAYIRIGRIDEGLLALERAVAISPDNPRIGFQYGRGLFGAEMYEEVLTNGARLMKNPQLNNELAAEILVLNASARMYLRDMRGAEDDLREAIRRKEDHAPAHLNLGVMLMAMGKAGPGLTAVRKASVHEPDSVKVQSTFAQMLEFSGRTAEAHEVWSRVARLDPGDGDVQMKMAYYYLGERDDEAARGYLEGAVAANEADGIAHYHLAEVHTRAEEYEDAWEHLEKSSEVGYDVSALRSRLEAIRDTGVDPHIGPEFLEKTGAKDEHDHGHDHGGESRP